jgi:hypothetical protein
MSKALTTVAFLATLAIPVAHAETPSSVLESLPAEIQKDIEDTRAACRAYLNDHGIADANDFLVTSGDVGLISFTLSGAQAVMVSALHLCGDQCLKGVTCSNHGGSDFDIYVRTGQAWRKALSTKTYGPPFLSLDWWSRDQTAFGAMVLSIPADSKDCPKRRIFIRSYDGTAWKLPCDVIVRWNGTKFTYEALD